MLGQRTCRLFHKDCSQTRSKRQSVSTAQRPDARRRVRAVPPFVHQPAQGLAGFVHELRGFVAMSACSRPLFEVEQVQHGNDIGELHRRLRLVRCSRRSP